MKRRLRTITTLSAAFILAFAACGGDSQEAAADGQRLREAAEATRQQGVVAVNATFEVPIAPDAVATMVGYVDLGTETAEIEVTVGASGPATILVTDGSTAWLSEDRARWTEMSGIGLGAAGSPSPGELLEPLQYQGTISVVGEERVDDVNTTRYRLEVDIDALPEATDSTALLAVLASAGELEEMTIEAWIGADNLIRRIVTDTEGALEGQSFTSHWDATLSEFGADVDIVTPPAGEIVPMNADG